MAPHIVGCDVRTSGTEHDFLKPKRGQTNAKDKTPPDAIALLKADHRKVEDLFEKFESAKGPERKTALAREICTELMVHCTIEEEIFYPACKDRKSVV